MTDDFFDEQTRASAIKAQIVSQYFWAWAKIILKRAKQREIGYVDLFAGPGVYGDGRKSTPILILEKAVADAEMANALKTRLNDRDQQSVSKLKTAVGAVPGIERLRHPPVIGEMEVDEKLVEWLRNRWDVPSLIFLDPWGYKGLTLELIDAAVSHRLTDVLFFFNFNRVNAAITNPFMADHVEAIFGKDQADLLRARVADLSPSDREKVVLDALHMVLETRGKRYIHQFRFSAEGIDKTSHYIVFVSKVPLGLKIIKEIMAKASTGQTAGVSDYEYAPRAKKQLSLFGSNPMTSLRDDLCHRFAGRTLTVEQIFYQHQSGTPYLLRNYKEALLALERQGRITCNPAKRQAGTMADHVEVTFPVLPPC